MEGKIKKKDFILLHLVFVIVALGEVAKKFASPEPLLSWRWVLFFGLHIASMGVYALLWQQVLKRVPLTTAFCNKAMTIVWGMIFGLLFFQEQIAWNNILGAVIVIAGVILVVTDGE